MRRNGLADQVDLIEGAVGSRTGSAVLNVIPESNWHRVSRPDEQLSGAVDAVDVDIVTVGSLFADRGLAPSDVHVVRFDVEGYETEVIEGMGPLLDADTPLLLFVEVHPNKLSDDALDRLIATLNDSGLNVVSSVGYDYVEWDGASVDVGSFEELREHRDAWSIELIARR